MRELPFSRVYAYRLIEAGVLSSVLLKAPGSKKPIRLVDSDSLDRHLERLAAEQKAEKTEKLIESKGGEA
jgi:hypothetical protein